MRVIELTQIMAGPFCGQVLADMGADVIKVEPPETGDQTRRSMGESAFRAVNRNKRSITLDLKDPADQVTLLRLVRTADVLLENYRPGVAKKLGADYATLREVNPRLIYASISGFGQTGPYAQRPGFDLIAQGMSGVMSVTGEPGGNPVKAGVPVSDLCAGLFCAIGILSALHARERTGEGQQIDTSLWEGAMALTVWETAELWSTGNVPQPLGSAHRLSAPYQALRTRDGYVTVGGNTQTPVRRGCARRSGGRSSIEDPRFVDQPDRMANRPELVVELERALTERDTAEWVETLLAAGVPAGPLHDVQQVVDDPHTKAREMVVEMEHPEAGTVYGLGIPVKLSATPGTRAPPGAAARRAHRRDPRGARRVSVDFELRGPAAWVTFNRPEAHNAMTFAMYDALVEACERVDADDDVRVMVLRGAGGRAFVAGHGHQAVHGVQDRGRRRRVRAPDRRRARSARGRAQADRRARRGVRDGQRVRDRGVLRPARDDAVRHVRDADRADRRQLPLDGQLRAAGRRRSGVPRLKDVDLPRAADRGRRGARDRVRQRGRRGRRGLGRRDLCRDARRSLADDAVGDQGGAAPRPRGARGRRPHPRGVRIRRRSARTSSAS